MIPNKPSAATPQSTRSKIAEALSRYGIGLILVVMVIVIAILTPIIRGEQFFLTDRNLISVVQQASINMILALGITFVITSGGIDLSIGSTVAFSGVLAALVMRDAEYATFLRLGIPSFGGVIGVVASLLAIQVLRKRHPLPRAVFTAIVLGLGSGIISGILMVLILRNESWIPFVGFATALAVGALCGLFNGFLITRLKLTPFIASLGTLGIFRGLALVFSEGLAIYGFGGQYFQNFSGNVIGTAIPVEIVYALVLAMICWFMLNQLRFGKYTTTIGGNEQTARRAGINVDRYKTSIYAFCGLLAGVAGALLLGRLRSGDPTYAQGDELYAIAAAVMGGTSLMGGEGSIIGTMVGALVISLVRNAMNLWNVPSYWQQVVVGSVIVLAVLLDQLRRQQGRRE